MSVCSRVDVHPSWTIITVCDTEKTIWTNKRIIISKKKNLQPISHWSSLFNSLQFIFFFFLDGWDKTWPLVLDVPSEDAKSKKYNICLFNSSIVWFRLSLPKSTNESMVFVCYKLLFYTFFFTPNVYYCVT